MSPLQAVVYVPLGVRRRKHEQASRVVQHVQRDFADRRVLLPALLGALEVARHVASPRVQLTVLGARGPRGHVAHSDQRHPQPA